MELDAGRIAELAGRPISALTRRDVAFGLLAVGADDALASLPMLRRRLLAAGNPLSAAFWESTETVLGAITEGVATTGDVREWLEATGTEPSGMIGLHVWDEPPERTPLQAEMHALLVGHLEEQLAAGAVDPDRLAIGDTAALRAYADLQQQWMTSPLPDGRVPMEALLDEKDAEFLAEWAAADADALNALRGVLEEVGERPLPPGELAGACQAARSAMNRRHLTGRLLAACGGEARLPDNDAELWLTLAAGVVSPAGEALDLAGAGAEDSEGGLDEVSRAMAALCALEHVDWLAVISALARGGPGTPASAADMAGYVREYCEAGPTGGLETGGQAGDLDDEDFDEMAIAELFSYVASLWNALGATDEAERLTPLGWWGLPEALLKVWAAPG
ncbi:MAG TPA: hypothetical protein VGN41_09815 [Streptosporangiaceae bacterium]